MGTLDEQVAPLDRIFLSQLEPLRLFGEVPNPARRLYARSNKRDRLFVDTEFKRNSISVKTGRVRCLGLLSELDQQS